jgi:hypothetical protein
VLSKTREPRGHGEPPSARETQPHSRARARSALDVERGAYEQGELTHAPDTGARGNLSRVEPGSGVRHFEVHGTVVPAELEPRLAAISVTEHVGQRLLRHR